MKPLRRLTIEAIYNADASTTTGFAQIIVMLCEQDDRPALTDDVWFIPGITDGTVTTGALASGTLAGSVNFTRTSTWGAIAYYPMVVQIGAALAHSDKIRVKIDVDVTDSTWVAIQAREAGDTTNRGILSLGYVGGI